MSIPLFLPSRTNADVQVFNLPSTVSTTQWHTWHRPPGVSMFYAICIGGGGGGGGGFTGTAATDRAGGGGGGSSGHATILLPISVVPAILYIQVGAGGQGTLSGGGVAGSGVNSFISIAPFADATNFLARSTTMAAVGGTTGTTTTAGPGGAGGTIITIGGMPLAGAGFFQLIAGQAGTVGGLQTGGAGGDQAFPVTSVLTMGGTGGGGVGNVGTNTFNGGLITAVAESFLSQQRSDHTGGGLNQAGAGGYQLGKMFFSYPGMGGSGVEAGVGQDGGNGFAGSGGGGGGGGTTGGRGGDGGNGIIVIICW